jgi:hypothetical protein
MSVTAPSVMLTTSEVQAQTAGMDRREDRHDNRQDRRSDRRSKKKKPKQQFNWLSRIACAYRRASRRGFWKEHGAIAMSAFAQKRTFPRISAMFAEDIREFHYQPPDSR